MPLYDYKNMETDELDVRFNKYEDRDNVSAPWVRVPSRICIPGTASDRPITDDEGILKQLSRMEDKGGSDFNGIGEFTKADLKRIHCDMPEPPTFEQYEKQAEEQADPDKGKTLYFS